MSKSKQLKIALRTLLIFKLKLSNYEEDAYIYIDYKNNRAYRMINNIVHYTEMDIAILENYSKCTWYLLPRSDLKRAEIVMFKAKHKIIMYSDSHLSIERSVISDSVVEVEPLVVTDVSVESTVISTERKSKKQAACVLIPIGSTFLGVSRKDNIHDFGLPGGKVDEGETPEEAAIRETLEETGLTVILNKEVSFTTVDAGGYEVITYLGQLDTQAPKVKVKDQETGLVRPVKAQELLNGSFGSYNKQLLDWYDGLSDQVKKVS